ncbi:hypothetical protein EBB07_13230 [Paenibacillaceae bacterium]|nr:hypothetical protein EBB07_13230 [Paenibacillaceae bacterium]
MYREMQGGHSPATMHKAMHGVKSFARMHKGNEWVQSFARMHKAMNGFKALQGCTKPCMSNRKSPA